MNLIRRPIAMLLLAGLAGCASPSPVVAPIQLREGMARAEVATHGGRPVRTEQAADGGERWFYYFGSQRTTSGPIRETHAAPGEATLSVGHETTTTTKMSLLPVHFSADGRVRPPLPSGDLIRWR